MNHNRPPHQQRPQYHQQQHPPQHPVPYRNQYPGRPQPKKDSLFPRVITGVTGGMLGMASLPCLAASIANLISGASSSEVGGIVLILIMSVGMAAISAMMLYYTFRKKEVKPFELDRDLERLVLSIAKAEGGRLTTAELALQCDLSLEESDMVLQDMLQKQIADFELLGDGSTVYLFHAFMKPNAAHQIKHQSAMDEFDQQLNAAPTTFDFDEGQNGQDGQLSQQQSHAQQHSSYKK